MNNATQALDNLYPGLGSRDKMPLTTLNTSDHVISPNCRGEKCFCGAPATHKVGEEGLWLSDQDEKAVRVKEPQWSRLSRHNWTAYVCCEHFGQIMGPVVQAWCKGAADE